ncbi:hypothetical protein BCV69DRAFT_310769 [Microstroma glucosiphilum]|uniref:TMEM14-domain-containing protein n=1 Tax=Pseudomicrostroma glucosiphilum TaxID=1684307 RepID=A0A316UDL5_9BASI|nr:hypothetical protein BCV69DRAFT_310769 [Pseudomicrostroma glucosiphilum]PWN23299.1 hypothetical protein BCV69DRAFT_310769 [Pseudomicrostroma glucosiphilum]
MSEHPAFTMAALTSIGGTIGFLKTRSVPSLVAGVGVGVVYALAGTRIKSGQDYGYELAAANSLLLVGSSAPRFAKGPVPKGLTLIGTLALAFYGKKVYDFRA